MLTCDVCGNELVMNGDGQAAHCKQCGMNYDIDRLRQKFHNIPNSSLPPRAYRSDFKIRGGILLRYYGSAEKVTIPDYVAKIGEHAFYGNLGLKSVVFPSSVKIIGSGAFSECSFLESVSLSDNIEEIGSYAFYECSHLQNIAIPAGVQSIGEHAFDGCSNLQSVVIPTGVQSIGDNAFAGCGNLRHVEMPTALAPDKLKLWSLFHDSPWYKATCEKIWKKEGRCAFCGGKLTKAKLFSSSSSFKCKSCKREKNY